MELTLDSEQGQGFASGTAACLVEIARRHTPGIGLKAFTLMEENASTKILARLGFAVVGIAQDADAGEVWEWRHRQVPARGRKGVAVRGSVTLVALLLSAASALTQSQSLAGERPPIIDMHLHALQWPSAGAAPVNPATGRPSAAGSHIGWRVRRRGQSPPGSFTPACGLPGRARAGLRGTGASVPGPVAG